MGSSVAAAIGGGIGSSSGNLPGFTPGTGMSGVIRALAARRNARENRPRGVGSIFSGSGYSNPATQAALDTLGGFQNNSPGWTGNQSIITSDMSVPLEGMAQDNLGIEPMETVTNGGNTVVDGVPVTTVGGGFSPQTTQTAQGIYGDISQRQRTLKKPLIKLT